MTTLIMQDTIRKPINGVPAGRYQWHSTKEAAEAVALPNTQVVETSPRQIWRALVERL